MGSEIKGESELYPEIAVWLGRGEIGDVSLISGEFVVKLGHEELGVSRGGCQPGGGVPVQGTSHSTFGGIKVQPRPLTE